MGFYSMNLTLSIYSIVVQVVNAESFLLINNTFKSFLFLFLSFDSRNFFNRHLLSSCWHWSVNLNIERRYFHESFNFMTPFFSSPDYNVKEFKLTMQERATDSNSFWISGAQCTNSCSQNLYDGFLINSINVINRPR